jgi:diguanylate cyclase (GGDEF)-like protein
VVRDEAETRALLPVPVSAYGPLRPLHDHAYELSQTSRPQEALVAVDAYEPVARAFGDEKTVGFLLQARMYAYLNLGWLPEALAAGERLLSHHQSSGSTVAVAKTLADQAGVYLDSGQVSEAMRCLARAELLLERTTVRNERYVSALNSLVAAALDAELYERAHAAYRQISQLRPGTGRTDALDMHEFTHAEVLLEWGLRLDQLGDRDDAWSRLRAAEAIFERWCDTSTGPEAPDARLWVAAPYAVTLAKLGDIDQAFGLAAGIVVPLRAHGDWRLAQQAHLALGMALRAKGDLSGARRELLAAQQLSPERHASGRLIVGFELAELNAQELGEDATRDLRTMIRDQARELWRQRLQRLGMLRQARQREEQEQARRQAEAALLHDPLTGLANRRRFDQVMVDLDTGRLPEPTVLLLIDVDTFKAINDTYSHTVGDQVLREIAAIVAAHCRAQDVPVRYAGDEFVVFLHADLEAARRIAERIRSAVRDADLRRVAPGLVVSVSIGAAALLPGMSAEDLFKAADANLYRAKRAGRDRVAV